MGQKRDIYDLDLPDLESLLGAWGAPRPAARELWKILYREWPVCFDQMIAIPQEVRIRLSSEFTLTVPPVLARQESLDGSTGKDLLELSDGEHIEVVLLRYRARRSACISTQVGCANGCCFCATGQMGFIRQLSSAEIIAQVLYFERELATLGERLTNIVLMGMGEPLLNYENTLAAIRRLVDPKGLGFVQRRITLSTVGIVPGIDRLAEEGLLVNLAVSLHAATDALRTQLIPINRRYPLDVLFDSLRRYTDRTRRRIMVEWTMMDGINDMPEQAEVLAVRLAGIPAHVNLILLNPTPGFDARPSSLEAVDAFVAILDRSDIPHTLRQRRGSVIAAGCGQLRSASTGDATSVIRD